MKYINYQSIINESDAVNAFLCGNKLNNITTENPEWVLKFNNMSTFFDLDHKIDYHLPIENFDSFITECKRNWNIPKKYETLDIEEFILNKCKTQEEFERVKLELTEYKKRDLYTLLKFLVYFVDTLRENDVIWGVGRGSSVSSYVLYLIGIHRVNSIKYNLDIGEFLK